jgi:hypothetical protein
MDRGRLRVFAGHQPVKGSVNGSAIFFEKVGKGHRYQRNGNAAAPLICREGSGFFLYFGIESLGNEFAARFLEQDFDFALRLPQVFLAVARELYALFKEFHGFVERQIRILKLADNFFQAREGILKVRLLARFRLFGRCRIHGCHSSQFS